MSFVRYFLLLIFALLARSAFAQPAAELHPVLNLPSGGAWNMCTSPEGHVYAATSGGLLRFADSTWELVTPDLIGRVTTVTADGADGLIIGTLDGRLFRTALRESIEWKFLLSSNKSEDLVANSMGVVLAGFYEGVYTSTDHGQTWKQGLTDGPRLRTVGVGDSLLVAFGTKSGSFTRMWTSTDLGNSWDSVTYVNGNAGSPQDVIIDKQGRIVVAALYDGVKLSSDTGKTWVELNEGLGDTVAATRIIEDLDGTLFIATWQDGIFRRGIKDSAWSSSNAGLFDPKLLRTDPASAESFAIALDSSANLYASTSSTFARAQRGDVIWTRLTRGFTTPHITALESFGDLGRDTGDLFVGALGTLARTSSFDHATWKDLIPGVNCDRPTNLFRASDGRLFAFFYCGDEYPSFYSQDNGLTWHKYSDWDQSICESGGKLISTSYLHMVSNGSDTVYASDHNRILISFDGGRVWFVARTLPHGSEYYLIEGLALDGRGRLYIESWYGPYRLDPTTYKLESLNPNRYSCVVALSGPFRGGVAVVSSNELRIYLGDQSYTWSIPPKTYSEGESMESRLYLGTTGGLFWIDLLALAKAAIPEKPTRAGKLCIFPNPAQDNFTLDREVVKQVYAVDALGHLLALRFDPEDKSVDVRALSRGCYVVLVNNGDETHSALLIKY